MSRDVMTRIVAGYVQPPLLLPNTTREINEKITNMAVGGGGG